MFAGRANDMVAEYGDQGFRYVFVVTEDRMGNPATAAYCESVRQQFELGEDVVLVMDPTGGVAALYGANDLTMVTDEGAEITFRRRYASYADIVGAIEEALGDW